MDWSDLANIDSFANVTSIKNLTSNNDIQGDTEQKKDENPQSMEASNSNEQEPLDFNSFDWSDTRRFDDDHDQEFFAAKEKSLAERFGGKFIKLRYSSHGRMVYYCTLCLSECNAMKSLETHCAGMKHLKKKDTWEKDGKQVIPEQEEQNGKPKMPEEPFSKISGPPPEFFEEREGSRAKGKRGPPPALVSRGRGDPRPLVSRDRGDPRRGGFCAIGGSQYYPRDDYGGPNYYPPDVPPAMRKEFFEPGHRYLRDDRGRIPDPSASWHRGPPRGRSPPFFRDSSPKERSPVRGYGMPRSEPVLQSRYESFGRDYHHGEKAPIAPPPPKLRIDDSKEKKGLVGSPGGTLLQKLAECCVKTPDDADLALSVVQSLLASLKEYSESMGEDKYVEILSEAESKMAVFKALKVGMKVISSITDGNSKKSEIDFLNMIKGEVKRKNAAPPAPVAPLMPPIKRSMAPHPRPPPPSQLSNSRNYPEAFQPQSRHYSNDYGGY